MVARVVVVSPSIDSNAWGVKKDISRWNYTPLKITSELIWILDKEEEEEARNQGRGSVA